MSTQGGYAGLLSAAAQRWPKRTALTFRERSWTYSELDSLVIESATLFRECGVGVGDRVLILMGNRPEYLIAQFALSHLGAAFVTPNPHWTDHELTPVLESVGADAVVAETRFDHLIDGCVRLPIPDLDVLAEGRALETTVPDPGRDLYMPFTSGTTGTPKAVRHTVGSLCGAVTQLVAGLALTSADRLQLALPLCHVFGATMSAAGIAAGAELTILERFDLAECLDHVEQRGVTVLPIAGSIAYQLADLADLESRDLSSLRFFMWGGSAVPADLARVITERTGVGFLCSYGMTEVPAIAFNPVADREEWSLESPGFPSVGTQWRLRRGAFEDCELEVSGPSVARGYLNGGGDAWSADGWFRTGDLARIDADGRLVIVDRVKDMLKVSGFQVSPSEVEQVLKAHPDVLDCGVFGEPDLRSGERPVAVIVSASQTLREEDLREWVTARLASYKQPGRYVSAQDIPRTAAGKTLRRLLRTRHGYEGADHPVTTVINRKIEQGES